ncbi:RcpC/CpaB family pilus assembly protein [Streptomyces roseolilacinus]|uniref:RcpC/CpaB family pilus assembly protein n=1 Tax=Streptomyces roseolilacinus TaxID=66904 RepID=UPI003801643F
MTSRTYRSASSPAPLSTSSPASFSALPSAPSPAFPLPAPSVPETCVVPRFAPLRVRGRRGSRWTVRRGRRAVAAGLAVTAAALAAPGLREPAAEAGPQARRATRAVAVQAGPPGPAAARRGARDLVSAPVRIADGATVRLLRPGDRVDVIAAPVPPAGTSAEDGGPKARTVAFGARVTAVPRAEEEGGRPDGLDGLPEVGQSGGALLVLAVSRTVAADLVAAAAASRLAVVLC